MGDWVDDFDGVGAYVLGLKLVFWGLLVVVALRLAGPAGRAIEAVRRSGAHRSESSQAVLVALAVLVLVAVVLGLFLAVFLWVGLHPADVVLEGWLAPSAEAAGIVTRPEAVEASGRLVVGPELVFPPGVAEWLPALPPVLLVVAGYAQARRTGNTVEATATVVFGYAVLTLLTVVPATWVFNEYVGGFLASVASTQVSSASLAVAVPDLVDAHLAVGVVYPLVFGGAGALLAGVAE